MEIEIDFPQYMPESSSASLISQKQTFEMSVEDMLSGEGQDVIAISQQNQESVEKQKDLPQLGFYNPDDEKKVDESYSTASFPKGMSPCSPSVFVQENIGLLFHSGVFYGISDEQIIRMLKLVYHARKEYLPDTLQNMLEGCLFFRKEPAMENSDFADAVEKAVNHESNTPPNKIETPEEIPAWRMGPQWTVIPNGPR